MKVSDPIQKQLCVYCNRRFTARSLLLRQMHNRHPQQDPQYYNCWNCGIQFRNKNENSRHEKIVKHVLKICQQKVEDVKNTDCWKELSENERYYAYMMEMAFHLKTKLQDVKQIQTTFVLSQQSSH